MKPFLTLVKGERPLFFQASLAQALGFKQAVILQYLHYWLNPQFNQNIHEGKPWVYNTYEEWGQHFPFWSLRTVRRLFTELEDKGLIVSYIGTLGFKKTKFYTLQYDRLASLGVKAPSSSFLSAEISAEKTFEKLDLVGKTSQEEASLGRNPPGQRGHQSQEAFERRRLDEGGFLQEAGDGEGQNGLQEQKKTPETGQHGLLVGAIMAGSSKDTRITTKNNFLSSQAVRLPRAPTQEKDNALPWEETEPGRLSEPFSAFLRVWNCTVQSQLTPAQPILPTLDHCQKLATLLATVVGPCLQAWESYCRAIARQGFLMGRPENPSGFRVSFDWALEPANALKVLEGAFDDKRALPPATSPDPATSLGGAQAAPDRSSVGRRPGSSSTNGSMPGGSLPDTTRPGGDISSPSLSEEQRRKEEDLAQQEPARQEPAWQGPAGQLIAQQEPGYPVPVVMPTAPLAESAAQHAPTPDRPTGDKEDGGSQTWDRQTWDKQAWNRKSWNKQACDSHTSGKGAPSMPPVPPEVAAWARVRAYLEARTTPAVYASWLHPLIQKALQGAASQDAAIQGHASQGAALKGGAFHNLTVGGTELILAAPTPFQRDYVQAHYGALLLEAVQTVSPRIQRVRLKAGDRL